ncbi:MAG: tetratricopeptide repeat protein, partial [Planctomycetota bacterium]
DEVNALKEIEIALSLNPDNGFALYEMVILKYNAYHSLMNKLTNQWLEQEMVRRLSASGEIITQEYKEPSYEQLENSQAVELKASIMKSFRAALKKLQKGTAVYLTVESFLAEQNEEAIKKLQEALEKDPYFDDAIGLLADIYNKMDNDDAALKLLSDALRVDRGNISFYARRARIYDAIEKRKTGWSVSEKGAEDWNVILHLHPDNLEALNAMAVFVYIQGVHKISNGFDPTDDFKKADNMYQKIVEIDPQNAGPYTGRGEMAWHYGNYLTKIGKDPTENYQNAVNNFKKAYEIDATQVEILYQMARVHWSFGDYKMSKGKNPIPEYAKGIEHCTDAMKIKADDHRFWEIRAILWVFSAKYKMEKQTDPSDDFANALADSRNALEIAPDNLSALMVRVNVCTERAGWKKAMGSFPIKEYSQAEEDISAALEKVIQAATRCVYYQRRGLFRANLGDIFVQTRDYSKSVRKYTEAIEDYEEAIRLNPLLKNQLTSSIEQLKEEIEKVRKKQKKPSDK